VIALDIGSWEPRSISGKTRLSLAPYSEEYDGFPVKGMMMVCRARFLISRVSLGCFLLILLVSAWGLPAPAQDAKLIVFAAASLKDALDEVNAAYQHAKGQETATSYAASSTLAKQIEAAAPADVFISADLDWMDYLAKRNLIKPETRANLLGNRLVLIAPVDSIVRLGIGPNFPLAQALGNGRLAIADPNGVPAGRYGKAALESLGVWSSVADKLAPAENVRATLLLVSRGEAPIGIVYQTDAAADKGVKILGAFPENALPPIIYPMAVVAGSTNSAAMGYLAHLKSPVARAIFEKQGFTFLQ
jgi:molybdate transport system substrate-binding protein